MAQRRAVDVAVMHVRAGLPGRTDDLLGTVDECRGREFDQVPGMGESRYAGFRGESRHLQVFAGSVPGA